ncbi:uncharacterized protein RHOBADRAFT_43769 [Rhodotorula graminis WP1]|uniref:Uncharacterized protein n=1 Tax=Rhodotorula graminis (strain WP1) TaxID=578459 RepID=A0A194S437_RHOGW|nr:uncharacterized protein RHOBADRAFT_43769 [Rhodotorula graminis WP1]KPV75280.1 hypothetical protein RHOBADRAFT_43769 [Rhodotorula graminis WP1]
MALASSPLSPAAVLLSPDALKPIDRLDTHHIHHRLDAERASTIAALEDTLATLDTLKRELVIAIHRRFVALRKHHRAHLCALAEHNTARELAQHDAKSALATFLARLASTFAALLGHALPAPAPAPVPSQLILLDPAEPPHTLDMAQLQDRVRSHEVAHRDALEGIYATLDALFAHVAAHLARGFERREASGRAALEGAIGRCEAGEVRNEEDRRSIVKLVEAVRSAFELFGGGRGAMQPDVEA